MKDIRETTINILQRHRSKVNLDMNLEQLRAVSQLTIELLAAEYVCNTGDDIVIPRVLYEYENNHMRCTNMHIATAWKIVTKYRQQILDSYYMT